MTTSVGFQAHCLELERKIAFTRYPFESPYWGYDPYVFIANENGGSMVLLAGGAAPSWSPDGQRIVFSRISGGCYFGCAVEGIFTMKRDGTDLVRLTSGNEDHNPAWSPDGTRIAFQRGTRLMVMNADGSSATFVNVPTLTAFEPAWSPDGTRLAFTCPADSGQNRVCLINPDGSGFVRLEAAGWGPSWHPDGSRLIFASPSPLPNGAAQVRVVQADGTGQSILTDGEAPVWSRDGSRIFFIRNGALMSSAPNGTDVREIVGVAQGWNYAPASR
jgi:TolB protein